MRVAGQESEKGGSVSDTQEILSFNMYLIPGHYSPNINGVRGGWLLPPSYSHEAFSTEQKALRSSDSVTD